MMKLHVFGFILFALNVSLHAQAGNGKTSLAYKWLDVALEVTANDVDRYGAKPTIQSRQLGIVVHAMYDAWASFDQNAKCSDLNANIRIPISECTQKNKETAISYAVYQVLLDLYPMDKDYINKVFHDFGFVLNNNTNEISTAQNIGNLVAKTILDYRHHDGANQLGDEIGGDGNSYSDYTFYKSVNTYKNVVDPDRWHPLPFVNEKGDTFLVNFLTPHWYRVKPYGLKSSSQFRAPDFPKYGSTQLKDEVQEVVDFNANLDHTRKSTIEFMRDGPRSTGQAGHWLRFAQMVSLRDHNTLDKDVKMFFAVGITAMDAFIACWETKRYYDSSRPWTLVRYYNKGKVIKGWGGPDQGTQEIPAERWHPYSPANFVSPPFPAYVSGHSTVSGACAKMLELFTGSDHFGVTENRICGIITETPGDPVSLPLPTFTATAEMAGISRVLGGYHIQADNIEGLKMGRKVANYLWTEVFQKQFSGK